MKFATVAVIAVVAVGASAYNPKYEKHTDSDLPLKAKYAERKNHNARVFKPKYGKHPTVEEKYGDAHITCAEKRERNPDALTGPIYKHKECCQWSGKCGKLRKCTQSYCQREGKESKVFEDRVDFDFQF